MRVVVVGGGILGLATARTLLRDAGETEVIVLERADAVATGQTGHNSGVVHAGLYYKPGSLKARLCRRGMGLMRDYCRERGVPYEECGKLVIASEESELDRFEALAERAATNGVPELRRLDATELREVEPNAIGVAALHSPRTAIVDFGAVARQLASDIAAAGGEVRTSVEVKDVRGGPRVATVDLTDGTSVEADRVIVCAGLESYRLARASGQDAEPRIIPFRGEYWKLRPERTGLVKGLIYPVPDPDLPFLGVHLTKKINGDVWLGPNAVLTLALDGYRRRAFNAKDAAHILGWQGTWRMMARNWRAGAQELASSRSKRRFIGEARRFVPSLRPEDAVRAPSGVRAQALDRDGSMVDDFRIGNDGRVLWVRNAPSPAATSSLAIAEELVGSL